MRKFDEVRLFLAGDEYEVRELSARVRLDAMKRAAELSEKLGTDEKGGEIVLAAALAAESMFLKGEKAFESPEEAMENLSAGELFEAAEINAVPERDLRESLSAFPEDNDGPDGYRAAAGTDAGAEVIRQIIARLETREAFREIIRQSERETKPLEKIYRYPEKIVSYVSETGTAEDIFPDPGDMRSEIGMPEREERRRREIVSSPVRAGSRAFSASGEEPMPAGDLSDMKYISDFFERDSRRYGGAFERF